MASKLLVFATSMLVASISLASAPDSDGDGIADSRDQCQNTPKHSNVDGVGCPTRTTRQKQYESSILFGQNDDQPLVNQDSKFERLIGFAKRYKNHFVLIEGYSGFNDTQADIGTERSHQIAEMLIENGVRLDKIRVADRSNASIRLKNDSPSALAQTQKVVVKVVPRQPSNQSDYAPLPKSF